MIVHKIKDDWGEFEKELSALIHRRFELLGVVHIHSVSLVPVDGLIWIKATVAENVSIEKDNEICEIVYWISEFIGYPVKLCEFYQSERGDRVFHF